MSHQQSQADFKDNTRAYFGIGYQLKAKDLGIWHTSCQRSEDIMVLLSSNSIEASKKEEYLSKNDDIEPGCEYWKT
jgi:hypothetical protein